MKADGCFYWDILGTATISVHYDLLPLVLFKMLFGTLIIH